MRIVWFFILLLSLPLMAHNQTVILVYHHISDQTPPSTSTTPALFKQHLDYLQANQFKVISLQQAIHSVENNHSKHPEKSVVLTFDDAYLSIYEQAFPILKKRKIPFTVFVSTESVEKQYKAMMNWQQLKELSEAGVTIANHSHTHAHLTQENQNSDVLGRQLDIAQHLLTERLQQTPPPLFAYPYGEFNSNLQTLLNTRGWYGLAQYSGPFSRYSQKTRIPRFAIGGHYSGMTAFKLRVNTLAMPVVEELPGDPHVERMPEAFHLRFDDLPFARQNFQCFYNNHPVSNMVWKDKKVSFSVSANLSVGRSRINCTAKDSKSARYYWHTLPLFNLNPNSD
ncbi:polysaccharide deacetylase family protein [Pleionea sp. CnH1-48]|uniref:polysaccharide deacetylase family protein n=1 Tax=Pleionea sp. CnH1-48 TaxID=2954494 RepID=UPI0020969B34|nr:polysaccharide deacetylase family protein [Pleionea sp. CnH1-48]MCO7223950.1 polysaccharide deacetylase family protein [Pleionea sp. CnH1-48]